jgi:ferredoxin
MIIKPVNINTDICDFTYTPLLSKFPNLLLYNFLLKQETTYHKTYKTTNAHSCMPKKVKVIEEDCIGCGACSALCPNFEMNDDDIAIVKKEIIDDSEVEEHEEAAEACPKECIKIEDA